MPCISIIIPVYKVENYLCKCLDSVLAQTFCDYEVILVDDGSPDHCGDICDEYAKKDDRIKVIHKQNGGLSDARNAALEVCTGEYLTFIDSDDYVAEDHLEVLYSTLVSCAADIAVSNISSFREEKIGERFYCPSTEVRVLEGKEMFSTLEQPCAQAKLYKRFIFHDIRFPVGKLYEDAFIFHDVLAKANKLVLTGRNTYFYLIRSDSIMHQEYSIRSTDIIDAVEARIKKLEEMGFFDLADHNREFVYSRVAVAFANLDTSIEINKKRLDEIKTIYDREYPRLMLTQCGIKQKFRYWLLFKLPHIHSGIFGKKMSVSLG